MPTFQLLGNRTAGAPARARLSTRSRALVTPVVASSAKMTPNSLKRLKKSELVELGSQLGLPVDNAAKHVKQELVDMIISSISSSDEESDYTPYSQPSAARPIDLSAIRHVDDMPQSLEDALQVPTKVLVDLASKDLSFPSSVTSGMDKEQLITLLWLGKPYKGAAKQQHQPSYSAPRNTSAASSAAAPAARRAPQLMPGQHIPQNMEDAMQLPMSKLVDLVTKHLNYPRKTAEGMEKEQLIIKLWLAQPSVNSSEYDFDFDINNLEDVERPSTAASRVVAAVAGAGAAVGAAVAGAASAAGAAIERLEDLPQNMEAAMQLPMSQLADLAAEHLGYPRMYTEGMEKEELIMKLWLASA